MANITTFIPQWNFSSLFYYIVCISYNGILIQVLTFPKNFWKESESLIFDIMKKKTEKEIELFSFNFSDMCEKLFSQLEKTTERFEVKLLMIDLASRLIGIHQVSKHGCACPPSFWVIDLKSKLIYRYMCTFVYLVEFCKIFY